MSVPGSENSCNRRLYGPEATQGPWSVCQLESTNYIMLLPNIIDKRLQMKLTKHIKYQLICI